MIDRLFFRLVLSFCGIIGAHNVAVVTASVGVVDLTKELSCCLLGVSDVTELAESSWTSAVSYDFCIPIT